MNKSVCVNCRNGKPVNDTDNRLVTESCGHVKCMNCLLYEKSGCIACLKSTINTSQDSQNSIDHEEILSSDGLVESAVTKADNFDQKCLFEYEDLTKKKKPETSHIKIETDANGRYYLCTVCQKKFHARSQVAYHAYCNGQRKPYQCLECVKSFATHSHYKYHMRVHRNERTYSCDVCGDSFFQMSKLQRHKLKHTKEKKYSCSQCSKGFNNLTSLRKHTLTHTEERPYSCPTCGRRFRDGSNFRKHVAKHEDKKCSCGMAGAGGGSCGCARAARGSARRAHACPRCPQAFHSGKDMRRHAAVHSDSKPFWCKVCNRRFRRKDNLERHIRNTHPDYIPANAVECDETALKEIKVANKPIQQTSSNSEKTHLEKLNPLPPLPKEELQKHMAEKAQNGVDKKDVDKSYILVANNARQSVIVGRSNVENKPTSPQEFEYVHKIRKASHISLPPINMQKMLELETSANLNKWERAPSKKDVYEKILYGEEQSEPGTSPDIHWRRKMKLNIN